MSETWTSLLSGVVGAIVGGAASLAGTMLVNKQQMAANARMRLYDELLPKITDRIDSILDDTEDPATKFVAEEQIPGLLDAVRRACTIVGPFERKASHNLIVLWLEYLNTPKPEVPKHVPVSVNAEPPDPPGYKRPPSPEELRLGKLQDEVRALSNHLAAKLG